MAVISHCGLLGAAIYPDRLKLCPLRTLGLGSARSFSFRSVACLARYCEGIGRCHVYWGLESGFPIGAHWCRAPCKSATKDPQSPGATPRLSLPFCVAPFHPSRSSRRGLALGWLCGAIAWSGMEGPGSVPSPPLSTSVFGQPWLGGQDRTLSLLAARRQLERGSSPVFFDCRGSRVQARAAMFPLPEKLRTVSGFGGRCHRRSLLSQVARRVRARAAALSVVEWWTLCG